MLAQVHRAVRNPVPVNLTPAALPGGLDSRQPYGRGVTSRALLISCVYEKLPSPAAARDLYVGPLFERSKQYAERQAHPWFILSGEHALVRPNDWLAPYDTDLNDTSAAYRRAWGSWTVAKLDREVGGLTGVVIEVHAPASYVEPIHQLLTSAGAEIELPLMGVPWGSWLDWYDHELSL